MPVVDVVVFFVLLCLPIAVTLRFHPAILYMLPMMKLVIFLFLPSIFILLLPALELFLCSRHIDAATADNDVVDCNICNMN